MTRIPEREGRIYEIRVCGAEIVSISPPVQAAQVSSHQIAEAERAAIVAYIRAKAEAFDKPGSYARHQALMELATAIEQGEHLG